jgi:DNA primase
VDCGSPAGDRALPGGIGGEHFFQKRGNGLLPEQIREGSATGSPFLVIDDAAALVAMAPMSAIELHPWGAPRPTRCIRTGSCSTSIPARASLLAR